MEIFFISIAIIVLASYSCYDKKKSCEREDFCRYRDICFGVLVAVLVYVLFISLGWLKI